MSLVCKWKILSGWRRNICERSSEEEDCEENYVSRSFLQASLLIERKFVTKYKEKEGRRRQKRIYAVALCLTYIQEICERESERENRGMRQRHGWKKRGDRLMCDS